MARLARIVVPEVPHHVTQRGNRREPIFFEDGDYVFYRSLIAEAARRAGTQVWAYCLMPNHVHMIATPANEDGLRKTFAEAHRRYTRAINARFGWTGHLFQGRFGAVAMDEAHLIAAARYIALYPVRAGLIRHPRDWPWSSVRAHLEGRDDALVMVAPLLERVPDFAALLEAEDTPEITERLDRAAGVGRPLGSAAWLADLEARLGRPLAPARRGPKPRVQAATAPQGEAETGQREK